jgi:hypothetical protein
MFMLALAMLVSLQLMVGKIGPSTAVIGLRSYVAPFLLTYLAWCYPFSGIWQSMMKILAAYAPVQAAITIAQVISPAHSVINKEVGSDAASFLNDGIVRASGTYSAPAGLSLYVPLALAACLYLVYKLHGGQRWFWTFSLVCTIAISVLSGSRGIILSAGIVFVSFFLYHLTRISRGGFGNILFTTVVGVFCLLIVQAWLPKVIDSFLNRFENASRSEDSTDRIVGQTFDFFATPFSFLGDGAGSHSIAGINQGALGPWIEIESVKWVAELGISGWFLACARLLFCAGLTLWIIGRLRERNLATVLIASALIPVLTYGQITHFPSAQGFLSICLALLILIQHTEGFQSEEIADSQLAEQFRSRLRK